MIGGKPARPGLFPFMTLAANTSSAALTWTAGGTESQCSGFIVSPTAIMAAAHCLHVTSTDTLLTANYSAKIGNVNRNKGRFVQLKEFIHPKYNIKTHVNDISILVPMNGGELPLGKDAAPIALEGSFKKPKRAIAMGWGKTKRENCVADHGEPSNVLLYHSQIVKKVGRKKIHVKGVKSATCMGDSGSPLVEKRNGKYVAFAILSAGDATGQEYYTRILPLKPFVEAYAKNVQYL